MNKINTDVFDGIEEGSVTCDYELLSELGRQAIGTRKIESFCQTSGLSKSFVSRLVNRKLIAPPTQRSLHKFAGPAAEPQNGVTAMDMLRAAGYTVAETDGDQVDAAFKNVTGLKDSLPLMDGISLYYSQSPAFGLNLFLNVLVDMGLGMRYSIQFQPGMFSIQANSIQMQLIGIPAFCMDEQGIKAVRLSAMQRFVMALDMYPKEESLFFILTDQVKLYELLRDSFPVIEGVKVAVLLSEDYERFSKQVTLGSRALNGHDDPKIENFPLILAK